MRPRRTIASLTEDVQPSLLHRMPSVLQKYRGER